MVKEIQSSSEKAISIEILRDGISKELTLIPKKVDGKGTIGAQLQPNISKETKKQKTYTNSLNIQITSFHHFW